MCASKFWRKASGPAHRSAAVARPRRRRFRPDRGAAGGGRLSGVAAAAARHRPKPRSADRDRPARLRGRRGRRDRARGQRRRPSWSAMRSAIGWRGCSPPTVRSWCARSRWWPPISARRRARPKCAKRSATAPIRRCRRRSASPRCSSRSLRPATTRASGSRAGIRRCWRRSAAGDRTSREEDFAAGTAPVLYLQPSHDPLAHVEDAKAYREQFGDRVTVVVIERASHAVIVGAAAGRRRGADRLCAQALAARQSVMTALRGHPARKLLSEHDLFRKPVPLCRDR